MAKDSRRHWWASASPAIAKPRPRRSPWEGRTPPARRTRRRTVAPWRGGNSARRADRVCYRSWAALLVFARSTTLPGTARRRPDRKLPAPPAVRAEWSPMSRRRDTRPTMKPGLRLPSPAGPSAAPPCLYGSRRSGGCCAAKSRAQARAPSRRSAACSSREPLNTPDSTPTYPDSHIEDQQSGPTQGCAAPGGSSNRRVCRAVLPVDRHTAF